MERPVFADASALVKLYADEYGADVVRALPVLVVLTSSRVEVPAALWRKHRVGELAASDAANLVADFEADYFGTDDEPPRFVAVAVTPAVLDDAARLAGRHGLRAYDAMQLAGALATHTAIATALGFVAFDKALCAAAAAEGIELVDRPD